MRRLSYLLLVAIFTSCTHSPQSKLNINNACSISDIKPQWVSAAVRSSKKWKVTVPTILAIVHQESTFQSDAKPRQRYFLGFIPIGRPSSALGYSQALNGTWQEYKRSTGNNRGDRENFSDSVDFIGWYLQQVKRKVKINQTYDFYLAYHEGIEGYRLKTFKRKKWLIQRAKKVAVRALLYKKQFSQCSPKIAAN